MVGSGGTFEKSPLDQESNLQKINPHRAWKDVRRLARGWDKEVKREANHLPTKCIRAPYRKSCTVSAAHQLTRNPWRDWGGWRGDSPRGG